MTLAVKRISNVYSLCINWTPKYWKFQWKKLLRNKQMFKDNKTSPDLWDRELLHWKTYWINRNEKLLSTLKVSDRITFKHAFRIKHTLHNPTNFCNSKQSNSNLRCLNRIITLNFQWGMNTLQFTVIVYSIFTKTKMLKLTRLWNYFVESNHTGCILVELWDTLLNWKLESLNYDTLLSGWRYLPQRVFTCS